MLCVISPAKRLDWSETTIDTTQPDFAPDALRLAKTMRNLPLRDLRALMDLSDDLARLNRDRFRAYVDPPTPDATRPAVMAFAGDTYQGLEAASLTSDDLAYAQEHLRILSGLYGLLRPCDAIQPYRLEMGSRLRTRRGGTLYAYWGTTLSKALNAQADQAGASVLVNCASQEYFGAVDPKALRLRVVTPTFMEDKDGTPKIVSFFAKRARGAMARFIVTQRVRDPKDLLGFNLGGYQYRPDLSTPDQPVFLRPYAAKSATTSAA
ncbi:MAG: peroxide stress protein YaaA [Paracoccaceae bacterium]